MFNSGEYMKLAMRGINWNETNNMRKSLSYILLWLCCFVAIDVDAAPSVVTTCNGCTGLESKNAADTALYNVLAHGHTTPYVYVRDESANTMTQYGVRLSEKMSGLTSYLIGAAPSDILNAYNKATEAVAGNGNSTVFHDTIPYSDPFFPSRDSGLNGYQFVMTSQAQNDISDILMARYGLNSPSSGPMDFLYKVFTGNSPYQFTVTVVMQDGSRITMTYDGNKFAVTEARDGANNNIPLSRDQVPGNYRGGNDGSGITGYLHDRYGAEINISGSAGCYNHYAMACTSVSSSIHCELVRCP